MKNCLGGVGQLGSLGVDRDAEEGLVDRGEEHGVHTLLQKQNSYPSMDGNGASQSVKFLEERSFFHAYMKLTLFGAFCPWLS